MATLGRCALVNSAWHAVTLSYHFKHWIVTLRDPMYTPEAKTMNDLLGFVHQYRFQRLAIASIVESLILRNDNSQVLTAFQVGGMAGAFSVNFSASMQDIVRVVGSLHRLRTFKLCHFKILNLSQIPVLEIQPAFDSITHFTYAGRKEISTGIPIPHGELCTLLSCFRHLEELVLDEIDIDDPVGGAPFPALRSLRKLVVHRCDDIGQLVVDLTIQAKGGQLPHLHHLELGKINPINQLACQHLIKMLAPHLTYLAIGHDYGYVLSDYLALLSFPLEFDECPRLHELRVVLDLSDPDTPHPPDAFEHLSHMLTTAGAPAATVRELVLEYGEAPATVARGDEGNIDVLAGVRCAPRIETCLLRRFKALRAVRFVPLREYDFASFTEHDRAEVRQSFRGLDLKDMLKF